jgi:hypothetical protein
MIAWICSVLLFVLSLAIGEDLLGSVYSAQKRIYPVMTKYSWILLTLATASLSASLIVMQSSRSAWLLVTFVLATVVGCMAAIRYTNLNPPEG